MYTIKAQTFAIRLSVHHKPCTYTGEICAHTGQLLNVHLLFLVVVNERLQSKYVLRSFRIAIANIQKVIDNSNILTDIF